ncbi:uncharacterized protein DS421_20g705980 [Arachis hypogaea]|nr:uncharacterized protein DS421_20g705980 [Arachis hypogaea]
MLLVVAAEGKRERERRRTEREKGEELCSVVDVAPPPRRRAVGLRGSSATAQPPSQEERPATTVLRRCRNQNIHRLMLPPPLACHFCSVVPLFAVLIVERKCCRSYSFSIPHSLVSFLERKKRKGREDRGRRKKKSKRGKQRSEGGRKSPRPTHSSPPSEELPWPLLLSSQVRERETREGGRLCKERRVAAVNPPPPGPVAVREAIAVSPVAAVASRLAIIILGGCPCCRWWRRIRRWSELRRNAWRGGERSPRRNRRLERVQVAIDGASRNCSKVFAVDFDFVLFRLKPLKPLLPLVAGKPPLLLLPCPCFVRNKLLLFGVDVAAVITAGSNAIAAIASFWPLSEPPPGQLGIAAVPFYSYCRIELSGLPVAIKTVSAIEEVSRPAIEAAVYFGWRGMILVTPLVYGFNFRVCDC